MYGVRGRVPMSRIGEGNVWSAECIEAPKVRTCGRRWKDLGPFGTERALHHFPSSRLLLYCAAHVPFSPGSVCPSCSINFHQHHILEHCMTEFRRQKGTFSIPDGQLTSALSPKLHFPQILSAKHPCHAASLPSLSDRLDTTPGRTTPSVGRGDLSTPAVRLLSRHTPTAQRLLQGMAFFVVIIVQDLANVTDLTPGIDWSCCQREEACACSV